MGMQVLSAKNLSKSFHARQVVKNVSLCLNSGETVGLLGPNGAGKTTTFDMIVGLLTPDTGSIFINDREISQLPMDQRSYMGLGYLPQDMSIFRKLTVAENIMLILQTRKHLSQSQAMQRLEELLKEFNVVHLRNNLGATLSGGERRRVEIARTLATDPIFLLLDEPFAGIDPISVSDIQNVMHYLNQKGIGVLITDHNVREILTCCNRTYIVNDGQIIADGSTDSILENEKVREVYLGDGFDM
ncbi:Lipopolysaccharide ABC transporter, ATP-binding protein LptB [uncultured Candidatus Thioglobus sp.]|nr:Lipopolysaccharide ABC transporter, ATP-binding protein LptB [uncultured Candidatus Thioglobus sp.]